MPSKEKIKIYENFEICIWSRLTKAYYGKTYEYEQNADVDRKKTPPGRRKKFTYRVATQIYSSFLKGMTKSYAGMVFFVIYLDLDYFFVRMVKGRRVCIKKI